LNVAPPSWRLNAGWKPALHCKSGRHHDFLGLDLDNTWADNPRVKSRGFLTLFTLAAASVVAVKVPLQSSALFAQAPKPAVRLTPSEIELYKNAKTLMDWTPREIKDNPVLRKLRPPGNPDQLPTVLERVGQTCADLFQDFPRVSCDEAIVSDACRVYGINSGNTVFGPHFLVRHDFRYIVVPRPIGDSPGFEEYRTDPKGNPLDAESLKGFAVVTSDFASSFLYLSPADQQDNRFRYLGMQKIREHECLVVGFAQNPESVRSANFFYFKGQNHLVLVQGLAWIDAQTFQVLRIITWLLAPRPDIELTSQTSTVDFYPVRPSESTKDLWLPRDVQVEIQFDSVRVHNTHHYTNFKLFRVESTIKPGR
jgi:hypothetical protein